MQDTLGNLGLWIVDHIEAVANFVFAAVVAVAAFFTARFTRELARETLLLRKAETDPDLAIYIDQQEREHRVIDMTVRNVGNGPAYDATFTIEPDPIVRANDPIKQGTEPKNPDFRLSDMSLFNRGIKYLAPDQQRRFYFTTLGEAKELSLPSITITATYYGKRRTDRDRHNETFVIDVNDFWRLHTVGGSPPEFVIAKAVKKLADDIHHLRRGTSALRVRVEQDHADYETNEPASDALDSLMAPPHGEVGSARQGRLRALLRRFI